MKPYPPSAPPTTDITTLPPSTLRPTPSPSITEHLGSTGFDGWIALIIVCLLLGTGLILILAGRARRGSTH